MISIGVGKSDFAKLRKNNCYYIDKTEILSEIIKSNDEVFLFTRPRRFGKTLMMSMMENFFNIAKDSRDIFEGLSIMNHPEFCEKYMNQYPVIFVSFKDAYGENFDEAYNKFLDIIAEACYSITELIDNKKINPVHKDTFKRLESKTVNRAEVEKSLATLMSILYSVYGKKVILLIDEYDVPIAKAFDKDENVYYKSMLALMKGVLSYALKDNKHLEFGIVTGCLRIAKQSIFTDVNNFTNYSIIDRKFSTYFGFTETEVQDMLHSIGCDDKLPLVREWYDGYLFGNYHMYCPWDVVNYLSKLSKNKNAIPQNFWENTSSNDLLHKFVRHKNQNMLARSFDVLLAGGSISISIARNLTYDMVTSSIDNIWSILLMTGYLTPTEVITDYRSIGVTLPNKEIQSLFESSIISKFEDTLDQDKQQTLMCALWDKDGDKATQYLTSLLDANISYFDYHENFYHAFLTGVFSGMGYDVKSNRETGTGRADMVIRDSFNKKVIIIETKRATDENTMDTICNEALQQIIDNNYISSFKEEYSTILCYGIAFYKKSALVKLMAE